MASGFETFDLGRAIATAEGIKQMRRQSAFDTLREQALRGQIGAQDQATKIAADKEEREKQSFTTEQRILGSRTAVAAAYSIEADPSIENIERWKPELEGAGIKLGDYTQATPEQIKTYASQIRSQNEPFLASITKSDPRFAELDAQHKLRLDEIMAGHKLRLEEISASGNEARRTAAAKPADANVNDQLITRPVANGLVQDYAWNPSTNQREPSGEPYKSEKGGKNASLPVGALRIVDEAKQALGAVTESAALIDRAAGILSSGKVDLGLLSNAVARGRNAMGSSSPASRAYSDVLQTFEKLRNNYLLLAKGVQTEGDATRAWNSEIGESAQNDNKLALQQLTKARQMISNMTGLQQNRIDTVYTNYGATPPGSEDEEPGGSSAPQTVPTATGPNGQKLILRNNQWVPAGG